MKLKSKILIIAGSDSSGGAGIQADIKTATCLGVYSMTAVTAVTVQNTKGVKSVISIPANEIYNQIIYTTKDIKPDAIKIGMLHSTQVINKVFKSLKKIKVNDPQTSSASPSQPEAIHKESSRNPHGLLPDSLWSLHGFLKHCTGISQKT